MIEDLTSLQQLKTYLTTVTPLLNKFTVCASGTLSISANGSYDVADYDMANVNVPYPTEIANSAWLSLPLVSEVGDYAFAGCTDLQRVILEQATAIGRGAFCSCVRLIGASAPMVESIGHNAFAYCPSLASVIMPACSVIASAAFYAASSLSVVSFPKVASIGSNAFWGCSKLFSTYFLGSSVPELSAVNAFFVTAIANSEYYSSTYGSIYVLPSLVDAFKSAENWSYYSNRITAYSEE